MPTCPHCKKQITELRFERDVKQWGIVHFDKDGDLEFLTDQPDDPISSDYFCPECNECIGCDDLGEFFKEDDSNCIEPKKYSPPIITDFDFRYHDTLRIYFNKPIGIGSYGYNEEEIKCFKNEMEPTYLIKELLKYDKLEDEINKIIKESLDKYSEINRVILLDWRGERELEIHYINQDKFEDSAIQEIETKLKELLEE